MKHFFTTLFFTFLACLFFFNSFAQSKITGSINGKVSSSSKQALQAAVISISSLKDSTFHNSVMTDKNGDFEIKSLSIGNYKLYISYYGFEGQVKYCYVSQQQLKTHFDIQLDSVNIIGLKEVTVVQSAPPIKIKQDTIEFNAGSFKTRDGAVVEDLLKKLPGVEVAKDGALMHMEKK